MAIKQAIVLAGGLGTRLRSVVPDLPKCMAPVAGMPFLFYVIKYFQNAGVEDFIFSLGYKHEVIERYLEQSFSGLTYTCIVEHEPLGTGGAIRLAADSASDETVLVLNGDTLFEVNLEQLGRFHDHNNADCTLALKPMHQFDRYGVVETNDNNEVVSFREKKYYEEGMINGGVYALNRLSFLKESLPMRFSFERDYLESHYTKRRIYGYIDPGYFIDIGIPEDYNKAQADFAR